MTSTALPQRSPKKTKVTEFTLFRVLRSICEGAPCPLWLLAGLTAWLSLASPLFAQLQMPDPKQMAGIPRPVTDLPNGAVSVRLIRGALSNNITNHPVELHVGSKVQTVKTDDMGRAEFRNLPAGAPVKATADVDGEHLESQEFPAPSQGGIRLLLVATDTSKGAKTEPSAPAVNGTVVIGSRSRILLEPGEETVQLYYVLEVVNNARVPVNTSTPFAFDMPAGATGTGVLPGSSPLVKVDGSRVQVQGPFPPGSTLVQIACELPAANGSVEVRQLFPAAIEQFAVIVKKVGAVKLTSPQVAGQQDVEAQGETFIAANGGAVAAGQPLLLSLADLPHHSRTPRVTALAMAAAIVLIGAWTIVSGPEERGGDTAERKRLTARRDKLFNELVRLEHDRRNGRANEQRYGARREELLAALEHVYGALDDEGGGPNPADRAGLAA